MLARTCPVDHEGGSLVALFGNVVRRSALAVAAAALLAGCSSGPGTPTAPAGPAATASGAATSGAMGTGTGGTSARAADSCAMLSLDQVSAALGQPAATGKSVPMFDTPECAWEPASGANGTVTLDIGPWEGDPGVKPLRTGTAVSGLGDEAYDTGNTGLYVRKGSRGLRIWVFNVNSQSSRLDLEKQLAAVVLAKL
jgi:hypothetical protein